MTEKITDSEYVALMHHLQKMDSCAIITTGRTGSDFLQSLFDSHTEVLTYNGIFNFHQFWEASKVAQSKLIDTSDLLDEFIGFNIEKLKSKYDYIERKDCLGDDGEQCLDLDLVQFKENASKLLFSVELNSRNFLLSVYGSYAMCLGQDLNKKSLLLHHIHHAQRLPPYLADFPNSKIICMTRDPRANFVSGVIHWRKYDKSRDHQGHLYHYIKRIIVDAYSLEDYPNDYMVVRIEDLGKQCILESLCDWLNIYFERTLESSTWGGLRWRGDRLSKGENTKSGWSASMLENGWEAKLSYMDKYLFNFLMNDRLRCYGYVSSQEKFYDYLFVLLVILMPLRFELRYISPSYMGGLVKDGNYRHFVTNIVFYLARVWFFYQVFFRKLAGFKFSRKIVCC